MFRRMITQKKQLILLVLTLLAVIAQGGADATGTILSSPRRLKTFKLTSTQGNEFNRRSLKGHWSLVFFGFTRCPTICPTSLGKLDAAYQLLKKQDIKALPQVIFVSLDPARDTLTVMRHYLNRFNKNFIGVTGSREEIDKLAKQLGVFYARTHRSNKGNYISHSTMIFVFAPNGKWVGLFNPPYDGETIAQGFVRIQKDY